MTEISKKITEEASQNILKGINIPPQPKIIIDLQKEIASPNTNMSKISAIISKDIGLSGSVLKVVNSPFFGLRNKITSIQQSLSLLGMANVVNIVNSMSLRNSMSNQSIGDMNKIWDSAMDIAMASAAISKLLSLSSPDNAYSVGLFHNCGIPLLMDKYDNYLQVLEKAYADSDRTIMDVESEMIDCSHAIIGYYVAKSWKLPEHLCQVIVDHHKAEAIFANEINCDKPVKDLLSVLKLAEHACKTYSLLGNQALDFEFERIKSDLLLYIGFSEYDLEDLLEQVSEMGL
jgi:HD-like signal output (HDOD) protein